MCTVVADSSAGPSLMVEKEQVHARIPAELLVYIDISTDILKSFYLLPSVMHRLESLMLASQLREEIGYSHSHSHISSSLVCSCIVIFYFHILADGYLLIDLIFF